MSDQTEPLITSETIDRLIRNFVKAEMMDKATHSDIATVHDEDHEDDDGQDFERHITRCFNCALCTALHSSELIQAALRTAAYEIAEGNDTQNEAMIKMLNFGYKIGLEHSRELRKQEIAREIFEEGF